MNACPISSRFQTLSFTALRVGVGFIMAVHGWGKLTNIENTVNMFGNMLPYPKLMVYLAIAGEFLGGLGLMVGLLTPVAAFGVFCVMVVAILKVHLKNGLMMQNNGFEYQLTLLLVSLFYICHGGGCLSLDALLCRKKGGASCCPTETGTQPPAP